MATIGRLMLLIASLQPVWAEPSISAYNCSDFKHVSRLSLLDVEPCPAAEELEATHHLRGAVIQRSSMKTVRVLGCRIQYTQSLFLCGMHSHVSGPTNTITTGTFQIAREDCLTAASTGILKLPSKVISDIPINKTLKSTVTIAGQKSPDGSCKGDVYEFRGISYNYVVVEREYNILISERWAVRDTEGSVLHIPTGISCPYEALSCLDDEAGLFVWSPSSSSCETDEFRTIYQGPIDFVKKPTASGSTAEFAVVTSPTHLFALRLQLNTTICGYQVRQSEHPRLYIQLLPDGNNSPFPISSRPIADLVSYIDSKFLYTELRLSDVSVNISTDVVYRLCVMEHKILLQNLLLARDQPELTSQIFGQPGIIGRYSGEVFYIAQCQPTTVTYRPTDLCYGALPVRASGNRSMFIAPVSHILVPHAEPIPCEGPFTAMFQLHGRWYQLTPQLQEAESPRQLHPDSILGPRCKVMDFVSAEAIVKSELNYAWGLFASWGNLVASIIGVLSVLKIINFLFKFILRIWAIQKVTGHSVRWLPELREATSSLFLPRHSWRQRRNDEEICHVFNSEPTAPPYQGVFQRPNV